MTGAVKIRVLSVDDHPLLREGLARIINDQADMELVANSATGRGAIEQFRQHRPDVVLLDIRLPDMNGIDVLSAILTEFRNARALMLTTSEGDVEIQRSLEAGARGYLLKSSSPKELTDAIRQVHRGKKYLSPQVVERLAQHMAEPDLTEREIEVLRHIATGNRNREIGNLLFISEQTVKSHISNIIGKLGAQDRTEAIAIALRRGILRL
jgi:DNA-binding NarL/FixJ family response regulator